jgi:hypothetical protein
MRLELIVALLAILSPAMAQEEEPQMTYYTREELREWSYKLSGFDEIRMTLAEKWVPYPIGQKKDGSIEFTEKRVLDTPLHTQSGIPDPDSFLALLDFEPRVPKLAHGCFGLFNLAFYRKGARVGGLHYAHGKYWQPLTSKSQEAVTRWLIQHGLPIEETMKLDKKEANQSATDQRP